ncbi:MAG: hypothetical protein M5U09_23040 [Gammaproteobacteria bacterium]|nr:hypothetical protein [Gammaproteobacteria bacterium]
MTRVRCLIVLLAAGAALADVPVVTDGRAVATVVIPVDALPVVRYAADELVFHVKQASGATLPVVTADQAPEGSPQLRIGWYPPPRLPRFDPATLGLDACLLRAEGQVLTIFGRDSGGPPLDTRTGAGTLMGVYELLASRLGVRWLWPGDLGVVVPAAKTIVFPDEDRIWTPQLLKRHVRAGNMARGDLARGFTAEGARPICTTRPCSSGGTGSARRCRCGTAMPSSSTGSATGRPTPNGSSSSTASAGRPPRAGGSRCASPTPGSSRRWCRSGATARPPMAWRTSTVARTTSPGSVPASAASPGTARSLRTSRHGSDRGWSRTATRGSGSPAQQLAAQEDPGAVILGYAYVNYAHPPTSGIQLNANIWIGTVPDLFFPATAGGAAVGQGPVGGLGPDRLPPVPAAKLLPRRLLHAADLRPPVRRRVHLRSGPRDDLHRF